MTPLDVCRMTEGRRDLPVPIVLFSDVSKKWGTRPDTRFKSGRCCPNYIRWPVLRACKVLSTLGAVIEYGNRVRSLPAPPSVVWQDLMSPRVDGARPWLRLLADEVPPRVVESARLTLVVWASLWPTRPSDLIVMDLTPKDWGSSLRLVLLADGEPPDVSKSGLIRKRVNHLLFADLRFTYGQ